MTSENLFALVGLQGLLVVLLTLGLLAAPLPLAMGRPTIPKGLTT